MISTHPEWVCELMNGRKDIEVRKGTILYDVIKRLIEQYGKAVILLYCTKNHKRMLLKNKGDGSVYFEDTYCPYFHDNLKGKVVARFEATAERIYCYPSETTKGGIVWLYGLGYDDYTHDELLERSRLRYDQIHGYLGEKDSDYVGTAVYVKPKTLRAFRTPKDITEFRKAGYPSYDEITDFLKPMGIGYPKDRFDEQYKRFGITLNKAPQSWCYVELADDYETSLK